MNTQFLGFGCVCISVYVRKGGREGEREEEEEWEDKEEREKVWK